MANYYIKRTDPLGNGTVYAAADGTWVATTGAAFVTTDSATGDAFAAVLNSLMLTIAAFNSLQPLIAPYIITKITA